MKQTFILVFGIIAAMTASYAVQTGHASKTDVVLETNRAVDNTSDTGTKDRDRVGIGTMEPATDSMTNSTTNSSGVFKVNF